MSGKELSGEGLPLLAALEEYSDPGDWKAFDSMKDRGRALALIDAESGGHAVLTGGHFEPYLKAWRRLEDSFLAKLISGELVATGYDKARRFHGKAPRIPSRLWHTLRPDFSVSSAAGGGMEIAGILVHSTETRYARAEREVRAWIKRRVMAGAKPLSKGSMLAEARAELGPNFYEISFNRAWTELVPDDWKKPGKKPGRKPLHRQMSSETPPDPLAKPSEMPRVTPKKTPRK